LNYVNKYCKLGQRQSPIDIMNKYVEKDTDTKIEMEGTDITSGTIHYEDHELKVNYTGGKIIYKSNEEMSNWTLLQFHFHAPSEHRIDGKTYALEMHNVFTNDADNTQLLVVGIMWEEEDKASDDELIKSLDLENVLTNNTLEPIDDVPIKDFYSKINGKSKYNYKGSLTTPT